MDTLALSIRSLTRRIRSGTLLCKDVALAHLDSLKRWNNSTNAACYINEESGTARATELDASIGRGEKQGLLVGVPFSAKDHIRVEGLPRSMGTHFRSSERAVDSDPLIKTALHQDSICIAKGNQTEFGKAFFTENDRFGKTTHFLDSARTPGGSGGGDAVIVATGGALFGLGVDASGSIRVPASFCGLYGLVPTHGLLPQSGLAEDTHCFTSTFAVPGILARSAEDLEIVFSALRSFDRAYPYSTSYPFGLHPDPVGAKVRRVGIISSVLGIPVEEEITAGLTIAAKRCEDNGIAVEYISSTLLDRTLEPFIVLSVQAVIAAEDLLYAELGTPRTPADDGTRLAALREKVRQRLPALNPEGLLTMLNRVEQIRRAAHTLFKDVDLLIAPVAAVTPPLHGVDRFSIGSRQLESHEVFLSSAMTNILGLPALAFPTHRSATGMPVGAQLIGPRFSELRMLALLHAIGLDAHLKLPPL